MQQVITWDTSCACKCAFKPSGVDVVCSSCYVCVCAAVVRYDLEFLGLCPCMVDVEIIDAKNDNQSIFVSAGQEACICSKVCGWVSMFSGWITTAQAAVSNSAAAAAAVPEAF